MSVLGAISQKDKGTGVVLPNLQSPPETTGFFQNIGAGFTQAVAGPHSTKNAKAIYESRHYDQIIQALNAEGEQATDMVVSPVKVTSPFYQHVDGEQVQPDGRVLIPVKRPFSNPFTEGPSLTRDVNPIGNFYLGGDSKEQQQIWDAVNRIRARKPGFLKQYPDQTAIDTQAMQQRQADQAQAGDVTTRATTLGKVGSFIGGMAGSITSGDPENFVGGWAGAPGKSVARTVLNRAVAGAATNAAAGVIAVPGQATDAESMGQHMTPGDMAHSVAQNAAAGALFGTAHAVAPHIPGAVASVTSKAFDTVAPHIPDAVRDPIVAASIRAGTVKDRQLLTEFQRMHAPYAAVDTSTPTEKAAAHVVTRDVETQEQSPLQPEAVPAHNNRLSAVAQALGVDLAPPDMPTTAPVQAPTVKGAPASFSEGIAHAEGSTRNPRSSADGYGNFLDSTWLSVAPHVTDTAGMSREQILQLRHDKTIATRATDFYAAQNSRYLRARGLEDSPGNLSLAHFLGAGDAAKVLSADPSTPVERLLKPKVIAANHEVLQGKSADQVIAWAHKRIGASVDHPPARPDAVADEGYDPTSPLPYTVENLRPEELPPTSAQAPMDEPFNHVLSQHLLVWENNAGERSIIDGGKRLAHARAQEDQNVSLPTVVLREKDGVSEEMALLVGKLKNVNLGTVPLEHAAGTLADIPEVAAALRNPQFHREIAAIAQLPYDKFGDVVNGRLDPRAALEQTKAPMSETLDHIQNDAEARGVKLSLSQGKRGLDLGLIDTTKAGRGQGIGTEFMDRLSRWADENGQRITLSPDTSFGASSKARLTKFYKRFGFVENKGRNKDFEISSGMYREPTQGVKGNQNEAGREASSGGNGQSPSGEGRNLAAQAPHENLPHGSEPSLFDRAIAARDAAEPFSDPVSPEAKQQADLLEHDLRADAGMPPQGEEDKPDLSGVFYHGSPTKGLTRLVSAAELGRARVSEPGNHGIYFTNDASFARRAFAQENGEVYRARLKIENPMVIKKGTSADALSSAHISAEKLAELKAKGYDAVVNPNLGEVVVFSPDQVTLERAEEPVHLFDLPETKFRISEEGEPVSLKQALTEAESDEAAAKALRDCL